MVRAAQPPFIATPPLACVCACAVGADVEAAAVDLPTGDALKRKLIAIVDEFAETKDVAEATACFEEVR